MTSYNLAIVSSNPAHLRLLAEKIHAVAARNSKKLSLAIIEFSPESATVSFQRHRHIMIRRSLLTDWSGVTKAFLEEPRTAMELAETKALGGLGPPEMTEQIRQRLVEGAGVPADEREIRLRRLIEKLSRRGETLVGWNARRRGESRALFPETRKEYEAMIAWDVSPKALADDFEWGKSNDCLDFHFSKEMITEFIRAVKELQAISDRTYVLITPRRPVWLAPTPEGRARLAEALSRVARETGAETIDLGDSPEFEPSDFADLGHLNESTGRPKFAKILAADVAARWSTASPR